MWYIYGSGGLGIEVMGILQTAIKHGLEKEHNLAFLVDSPKHKEIMGLPVVPVGHHIIGAKVTIAVGEPSDRAALFKKVDGLKLKLASVVSPFSVISGDAEIGNGVIIGPNVSVQPTAKVHNNVVISPASVIGHDVVVKEHCVISSGVNLGGGVYVENLAYIGMGALIRERLCIGSFSIVGMGAVVVSSVPDEMVVFGVPARVIRKNVNKKVFNS